MFFLLFKRAYRVPQFQLTGNKIRVQKVSCRHKLVIERQDSQEVIIASITFTIKEWTMVELVCLLAELILVILHCGGEIPAPHSTLAHEQFFWRRPEQRDHLREMILSHIIPVSGMDVGEQICVRSF